MKKYILLSLLLVTQIANAQYDLPVNFESTTITYTLTDFGGNVSSIVVDPTDATNSVAQVTKTGTAESWAGTTISEAVSFTSALAFSNTLKTMTVRVWSPDAGTPIRLKVEVGGDPTRSVETETLTTKAGEWEVLTFNFANQANGTAALNLEFAYNKASLFFNFGQTGVQAGEKTYYFDDVMMGEPIEEEEGGLAQIDLPVNFEGELTDFTMTDFGGNVSSLVVDPTNAENKVMQVVKTGAAELWAGTTIGTDNGFKTAIPFSSNLKTMTVRVWSPDAGIPIRLKVEDSANSSRSVETEATTTVAGGWEMLTFNFANQAAGTGALNLSFVYNKASLFFNFGQTGVQAGEKTYYFDDVMMGEPTEEEEEEGGLAQIDLPVNFEDELTDFTMTDFGGNVSSLVVDPTNAENSVIQVVKTGAAELWAGTTIGTDNGFKSTIPFSETLTSMTIRVWSPDANIPVRLKVEDSNDGTRSVETEATTTKAGEWDVLTFNFANQAAGTATLNLSFAYNKASIFFNFGQTGTQAGEKTYYFDDVMMGSAGEEEEEVFVEFPLTFEESAINWASEITNFDGGLSTVVENPDKTGENTTDKVVRMVKNGGQTWGGSYITVNSVIDLNTSVLFEMKIWAPNATDKVLFKLENNTNPNENFQIEKEIGVANAWTTISFDLSAAVKAFEYRNVILIFNNGTAGDGSANSTWYFDEINHVGGSGGISKQQIDLPVTFDDPNVSYSILDFGGAYTELVVDPTKTGNNVMRTLKPMGSESWAGTTIGTNLGFKTVIPFTADSTYMNIRVWSPDAGIPIRLKVEDSTDPTKSVETETMTTVANAWEIIPFNFANQVAGTSALNIENSYNKASIFFNFGQTGDAAGAKTYYWDNVKFGFATGGEVAGELSQIDLPVDFEGESTDFTMTDFGGNVSTLVVDPTNSENKVMQVVKTGAAESWAGTTIGGEAGFKKVIPFTSTLKSMTVRVWSPDAGIPVRLKVEVASDGTRSVETEATTSIAAGWETLTFDFANQASGTAGLDLSFDYNKASIFFNFGQTGTAAGEKTYYFDDVMMGEPGEEEEEEDKITIAFPVDFEIQDADWTKVITPFEGGATTVVANPAKDVNNSSETVVQMIKNGGQPWAGAFFDMTDPMDLNVSSSFSIKVWTPRANSMLLFKIENSSIPSQNFEVNQPIGLANAWTVVNFDLSAANKSNPYNRVVLIFDLGTTGDGSADFTYYFDEVDNKIVTSNEEFISEKPTETSLLQNFPNPFNPSTTIAFALKEATQVSVDVFDVLGKKVATIVNQTGYSAGNHTLTFDASRLSTGMYFYRLQTATGFSAVKSMTLIK